VEKDIPALEHRQEPIAGREPPGHVLRRLPSFLLDANIDFAAGTIVASSGSPTTETLSFAPFTSLTTYASSKGGYDAP
jgi:hypothetical protein